METKCYIVKFHCRHYTELKLYMKPILDSSRGNPWILELLLSIIGESIPFKLESVPETHFCDICFPPKFQVQIYRRQGDNYGAED